jgi:hypothetical protein
MALYAGLPTLVLAGVALWSRPRDPLVRFFAAAALIALLLALGDTTPFHGLLHSLPVFRALRAPARYVLLVDVALAVLAALGLDSLQKEAGGTERRRARMAVFVAALLAAGLPFAEPLWRPPGRDGWYDADWARAPRFWPQGVASPGWLTGPSFWRRPRTQRRGGGGRRCAVADLLAFAATSFDPLGAADVVLGTDAAHALAAAGPGRAYIVSGPTLAFGFRHAARPRLP